ncbi:hypothetical protein E8E15_011017 [Penicillium rubens]|uniref:Uncharacterized protein n=1 Tax=Penicillium chrysogenum TaxID=5076 RepID=A0A167QSJ7_PENCH|nr:uncharacterized protein N7525_001632 [Penicillium rubens]KZN85142.1 hypothetical protein EN45_093140 [Penicillium chrysogenum]KAF3029109.1 hypothetical protein E8E15_011017 [Penicillium rubens]KAJ5034402.1 hypothetical protein NUH16_005839 [Penicillium rubens]KAJ5843891.1 hypothetical protein N7525_001632 [Penicillium rubens]KAJ5845521.1 hypothetical protein N7534_009190 [Penicillium rubens]
MPRKKAPPFLGPSPPGDTFDDFHMKQSAQAAHIKLARHRPIWTNDWTPVHTTGNRLSAKDIARFPLYVNDELVYAAMKELAQKKRAEFRAVWDANGEPRASRVPQDPAPRIDFHGLLCAPIWKKYYAFVRLRAAAKYGYLMAAKADLQLKSEDPIFTRLSDAPVFLVISQNLVETIECAWQPNTSGATLNSMGWWNVS